MHRILPPKYYTFLQKYDQTIVLLAIVLYIAVLPITHHLTFLPYFFEITTFVIILFSFLLHNRFKWFAYALLAVAVSARSAGWIAEAGWPAAELLSLALFLLFLFFYMLHVGILVYSRSKFINWNTVLGATNIYLLIGILFATTYELVDQLDPIAFKGLQDFGESYFSRRISLLYYSFITLTTVGYGDITPKSEVVAVLAYMQALIGQLYLVIMMARLVGLQTSNPRR